MSRDALMIAVPAVMAAILAMMVKRFAPITPGANLARVRRAYMQEPEVLDARSVLFTFFLTVGTAAGIAAIFRTPITGVVFAVEEVLGTTTRGVLGGTIIAAVAAAVVENVLLGKDACYRLQRPPGVMSRSCLASSLLARSPEFSVAA